MIPGVSIAIVTLALVEAVVLLAVVAGGFAELSTPAGLGLGAQLWLLSLGVPLNVAVSPLDGMPPATGVVSLVPLGLSLATAAMAFLAGSRLARRAPAGAGLAAVVLTTAATHALIATGVAVLSASAAVQAPPLLALAFGGVIVLLATAAGALVGEGTPAALVGARLVSRARKTGQDMRWAGSYLWSVLRAGVVATVAAIGVGALLLAVALVVGWQQVVTIQQQLGSGVAGDTVFLILHLALLPNFLVWSLAWGSGAGFYLGDAALVSPAGTNVETLPLLPVFGALPPQEGPVFLAAAPALVVVCGILAGWWFVREGENHLGEWIAIRIPWRVISAPVVVLVSGILIGAVTGLLVAGLAAAAGGSLGLGRMNLVGPSVWETAAVIGLEVAVGAAIGTAVAPWVEQGRPLVAGAATGGGGVTLADSATGPSPDGAAARTDSRTQPVAAAKTPQATSAAGSGGVSSEEATAPETTDTPAKDPGRSAAGLQAGVQEGDASPEPDQGRGEQRVTSRPGKLSRGAVERDREQRRHAAVANKQRQRAQAAELKNQQRYAAAQKRRERRKAARDR